METAPLDISFYKQALIILGAAAVVIPPIAWTGRRDRSGVPRFRAFVLRVAEAIDGHLEPRVDCSRSQSPRLLRGKRFDQARVIGS